MGKIWHLIFTLSSHQLIACKNAVKHMELTAWVDTASHFFR